LKDKKRPILVKFIRALSRHVGRADGSVRKWIARDDWPFSREGPWDVEKVRAWMEIHLKPDAAAAYRKKAKAAESGSGEFAGMGILTKARAQKTYEQILQIRQRRMIEAGDMHNGKECEAEMSKFLLEARRRLAELPRTVSKDLVGREAVTIEGILETRITEILNDMARGMSKGKLDGSSGEN